MCWTSGYIFIHITDVNIAWLSSHTIRTLCGGGKTSALRNKSTAPGMRRRGCCVCLLGHGWTSGCPSAPLITSLTAPCSGLTDLRVQVLKTEDVLKGTSMSVRECDASSSLLSDDSLFPPLCLSIHLPSGWKYSNSQTASTVAHVQGQGSCL